MLAGKSGVSRVMTDIHGPDGLLHGRVLMTAASSLLPFCSLFGEFSPILIYDRSLFSFYFVSRIFSSLIIYFSLSFYTPCHYIETYSGTVVYTSRNLIFVH